MTQARLTLRRIDIINTAKSILKYAAKKQFVPIIKQRYEKSIQLVLFGYLQGRYGNVRMEYTVQKTNKKIDFRYFGGNPCLIELATIGKAGYGVEHNSNRNRQELLKLSQFSRNRATTKYLLILDFKNASPIPEERLKESYKKTWGKLKREVYRTMFSVTILYVHKDGSYPIALSEQPYKRK